MKPIWLVIWGTLSMAPLLPGILALQNPPETSSITQDGDGKTGYNKKNQQKLYEVKTVSLDQAVNRPLFSPDRHPWVEPLPEDTRAVDVTGSTPQDDATIAAPPEIELLGLALSENARRGLIMEKVNQKAVWVASGEMVGDWAVGSITSSSLFLVRGEKKIEITLHPEPSH